MSRALTKPSSLIDCGGSSVAKKPHVRWPLCYDLFTWSRTFCLSDLKWGIRFGSEQVRCLESVGPVAGEMFRLNWPELCLLGEKI